LKKRIIGLNFSLFHKEKQKSYGSKKIINCFRSRVFFKVAVMLPLLLRRAVVVVMAAIAAQARVIFAFVRLRSGCNEKTIACFARRKPKT
jgi:hypothetical protein